MLSHDTASTLGLKKKNFSNLKTIRGKGYSFIFGINNSSRLEDNERWKSFKENNRY